MSTLETSLDPPNLKSKPRRFDSVKNLLEKVRTKLSSTKNFMKNRSRSRNRTQSQGPPDLKKENNTASVDICLENKSLLSVPKSEKNNPDSELSGIEISQSSPATPAEIRKEKRYRSFSPVRSFLNSPLMRRRKKNSMDSGNGSSTSATSEKTESSEAGDALTPDIKRRENLNTLLADSDSDGENDSGIGTHSSSKEFNYHNLETFQKKKLKQKLKNMNKPSTTAVPSEGPLPPPGGVGASTGPYPSPPPAPQRVPHPPRKNLQHASGLLQPSTPLLPRRTLKKHNLSLHPGNTPTSTPNPTPNVRRRGLNALIQQYQQQNQVLYMQYSRKNNQYIFIT